MTIGERIKTYRKEKGYTLKQLSEITKLSTSFISDIEHGRSNPGVENLGLLAKALNVTTDEILGNSAVMQSPQKPYFDVIAGAGSVPKDVLLNHLLSQEEKAALDIAKKNKYSNMVTRNLSKNKHEIVKMQEDEIPVLDDPGVRALARRSLNKDPNKQALLKKLITSMLEDDD